MIIILYARTFDTLCIKPSKNFLFNQNNSLLRIVLYKNIILNIFNKLCTFILRHKMVKQSNNFSTYLKSLCQQTTHEI